MAQHPSAALPTGRKTREGPPLRATPRRSALTKAYERTTTSRPKETPIRTVVPVRSYLLPNDRPRDLVSRPRTFDLPEVRTQLLSGWRTASAFVSPSPSSRRLSASYLLLSACSARFSATSARLRAALAFFWASLSRL